MRLLRHQYVGKKDSISSELDYATESSSKCRKVKQYSNDLGF